MQLIDGKKIAERIKDEIVREVVELGERPNLAIILVGEREDSKIYVSLKEKQAKEAGIDTNLYKCDENIKEEELLSIVDFLNDDESIDAILIQLPLPQQLDADKIIARMKPEKDVDGFHPENLKSLLNSCDYEIEPPLVTVILEILKDIGQDIKDKKVAALVNSEIFGKPIKHVLECKGAEVEILREGNKDLFEKTSCADVLIVAIGKPRFVTGEMIKKDAIIIDIGINKLDDGTICGDVYEEDVEDKAAFLTPVPGGVGPITIAAAFKNSLYLYKKRRNK